MRKVEREPGVNNSKRSIKNRSVLVVEKLARLFAVVLKPLHLISIYFLSVAKAVTASVKAFYEDSQLFQKSS